MAPSQSWHLLPRTGTVAVCGVVSPVHAWRWPNWPLTPHANKACSECWLGQYGAPLLPPSPLLTGSQVKLLCITQRRNNVSDGALKAWLHKQYGINSRKELRLRDLNTVLDWLTQAAAKGEIYAGLCC